MRTTITIDDKLFHRLEGVAESSNISFKEALNATIESGLKVSGLGEEKTAPFIVKVVKSRLRPGFDEGHLNAYLDELDATFFAAEGERA
jgi:hypothetical protein